MIWTTLLSVYNVNCVVLAGTYSDLGFSMPVACFLRKRAGVTALRLWPQPCCVPGLSQSSAMAVVGAEPGSGGLSHPLRGPCLSVT